MATSVSLVVLMLLLLSPMMRLSPSSAVITVITGEAPGFRDNASGLGLVSAGS